MARLPTVEVFLIAERISAPIPQCRISRIAVEGRFAGNGVRSAYSPAMSDPRVWPLSKTSPIL